MADLLSINDPTLGIQYGAWKGRMTPRVLAESLFGATRSCVALFLIVMLGLSGDVATYAQAAVPPSEHYGQLSFSDLDQLVAPIALYPDALVAQVLAAATYPNQIVEANLFVEANQPLPPQEKARLADLKSWDPGVKSLTEFPTVLSNMTKNLPWTTQLGNAYYNQPQDVMAAVQRMRERAYQAGTLRSTPQLSVGYQPGYVVIQPVSPSLVYVPVYNPWIVYGAPVPIYPAYTRFAPPAGAVITAAAIGFTAGVIVSAFAPYNWGCGHWVPSWNTHTVIFNNGIYVSRSVTVINHGRYGYYDHSAIAREYNRQVIIGPHGGVATRTFVGGPAGTNVRITGPQGGSYDRATYAGGSSTTITGPNGQSANRTITGRGTGDVTATTTGPNGTTTRNTQVTPGGSTTTITGQNGQTVTHTVTGRGTGDVTATTTGPNGTTTRNTQSIPGGNSTTVTGPNGQLGTRTVTGRGTGDVNTATTGANGGSVNRQTVTGPHGGTSTVTATSASGKSWTHTRRTRPR
jgi:hypothetical protein